MNHASKTLLPFAALSLLLAACASTGTSSTARSTTNRTPNRAAGVAPDSVGNPAASTTTSPEAERPSAEITDRQAQTSSPPVVATRAQPMPAHHGEGPYGAQPDAAEADESSTTAGEGQEVHFGAVTFAYDSARLSQASKKAIRALADHLLETSTLQVTVEGHCDERGTEEYNLALGHLRATAIKHYLVELGVPAERVRAVSFGEERPATEGTHREALAQNRRGEFVLYGEGEATAMRR